MKYLYLALLTLHSLAAAPRSFEQNLGQADSRFEFFTRQRQGFVAFTRNSIHFTQPGPDGKMQDLTLTLRGARSSPWQGTEATGGNTSYHTGSDPSRWINSVPHFARLIRKEVYTGIDLVFYFAENRLEYDFIVHPGADPSVIRLESNTPLKTNNSSLTTRLGSGDWRQHRPILYQNTDKGRNTINGGLKPCGPRQYCFFAQPWRRDLDLVIDPILEFSTYLGGENDEEISVVSIGMVAGSTTSASLLGAEPSARRQRDIFLRWSDPKTSTNVSLADGFTLIVGGSGDDEVTGLNVTSIPSGGSSILLSTSLCGTTSSPDLFAPENLNLPQSNSFISTRANTNTTYGGGASDAFLMSVNVTILTNFNGFNPNFIGITGSYIGGSGADRAFATQVVFNHFIVVGETTSTDLSLVDPIQSTPGGQTDAFVAAIFTADPTRIAFSTYLGGSGDDSARATTFSNNPGALFIGGYSSSPDFPNVPGSLSGPSDAFVIEFRPVLVEPTRTVLEPKILLAARFGGDGEDRILALANTSQQLYFGGDTTSTNLPVKDAFQPTPSGGLDAFLGRLNNTTLEFSTVTYIGGNGDDRIVSLSSNSNALIGFGGSTTSPNLKLLDALQSELSGPSDGFFGAVSNDGQIRQLSYFGGSGEDRINSVVLFPSGLLRVAGPTTSPDVPVVKPWLRTPISNRESFIADISSNTFDLPPVLYITKGYDLFANLRTSASLNGAILNIRIADPSIAGIVRGSEILPQLSTTLSVSSVGSFFVGLTALVDSGQTTATFEIAGVGTRTVLLRVARSGYRVLAPAVLDQFSVGVSLNTQFQVLNPDNESSLLSTTQFSRRAGASPFSIRFEVADPSVLNIENQTQFGQILINALQPGSTSVTSICSDPLISGPTFNIEVVRPRLVGESDPIFMTTNETRNYGISTSNSVFRNSYAFTGRFRIESEDPSRLLISTSAFGLSAPFAGAIELNLNRASSISFVLKALASSGDVRVKVSDDSLAEDFYFTVSLRRVAFEFRILPASSQLVPILPVGARFALEAKSVYEGTQFSPGSMIPTTLNVISSNPSAVANKSISFAANSTAAADLSTLAAGTTSIRFQFADSNFFSSSILNLEVSARAPINIPAAPIRVGKDLQVLTSLFIPYLDSNTLRIGTSDPSLVRLRPTNNLELTDRLEFTGNSALSFYAVGLAQSGTTTLRLSSPNREDFLLPVQLGPSGFAFDAPYLLRAIHSNTPVTPRISPYLLDNVTLAPVRQQSLRPGITASVPVASDNPAISFLSETCPATANNNGCRLTINATATGIANFTAGPVEGFTTPAVGKTLQVEIRNSVVSLSFFRGVKDTLSASQLGIESNTPSVQATITSLDPTLTLLSQSADSPGVPSINSNGGLVFLHTLADSGTARISITGPSLDPQQLTVPLTALALTPSIPFGATSLIPATMIRGVPVTARIYLASSDGFTAGNLRPGVAPIRINVENSNPAAIRSQSTLTIEPGTNFAEFTFEAIGDGEANISFTSPGLARIGPFRTQTRRPTLRLSPVLAGRGTISSVAVSIEPGSRPPTDNAILTIRSGDPARLRLGRTSGAEPSESISIVWQAGSTTSNSFFLYALASSGETNLEFSLPEFDAAKSVVYLTSSYFAFVNNNPNPLTVRVKTENTALVGLFPAFRADVATLPGLITSSIPNRVFLNSPLAIPVSSSNPGVVAVRPVENFDEAGGRFTYTALSSGSATLTIGVPAGFATPPPVLSTLTINVELPAFPADSLITNAPYESVTQLNLFGVQDRPVTITSSRPVGLLLSRTLTETPRASITIPANTPNSNSSRAYFVHGLARTGTTELTYSADEYQTARSIVAGSPSSFVIGQANFNPNPEAIRTGQSVRATVQFVSLDAQGRTQSVIPGGLRPNTIPVTVNFTNSDPTVVRITPATLTFNPGESVKEITIEALKPGNALVEASVPAGFSAASARTVLYRVIAPN